MLKKNGHMSVSCHQKSKLSGSKHSLDTEAEWTECDDLVPSRKRARLDCSGTNNKTKRQDDLKHVQDYDCKESVSFYHFDKPTCIQRATERYSENGTRIAAGH